jgi:hypothetical protein
MIKATFNTKQFRKDMNNIIDYSVGFLDGVQQGKKKFLENLGESVKEILYNFIDSNARLDEAVLQHIYEWEQSGSPNSRLYDIYYTVSNLGLSMRSSFRQSNSVQAGSTVPFYDKARIMEQGIPVVIKPKNSSVLVFNDNGEQVFTRQPVTVSNPGGAAAKDGFGRTFDNFFNRYFTQSFLKSSGLSEYLTNPIEYKKNLKAGSKMGKGKGVETGYRWITNTKAVSQ